MRFRLAFLLPFVLSASAQNPPTVLAGLAHLKEFTVGRAGSYDRSGGNADRLQMKPGMIHLWHAKHSSGRIRSNHGHVTLEEEHA